MKPNTFTFVLPAALLLFSGGVWFDYTFMAVYYDGQPTTHGVGLAIAVMTGMGVCWVATRLLPPPKFMPLVYFRLVAVALLYLSPLVYYAVREYTIYFLAFLYTPALLLGVWLTLELTSMQIGLAPKVKLKANRFGIVVTLLTAVGVSLMTFTNQAPLSPGTGMGLVAICALSLVQVNAKNMGPARRRVMAQPLACVVAVYLLTSIGPALVPGSVVLYDQQANYYDKVVYAENTAHSQLVMTQWRSHYYVYLNGQKQFSTIDEAMYYEPLVHTPMALHPDPKRVLVIGGDNGLALREVLKYNGLTTIRHMPFDAALTQLFATHAVIGQVNQGALVHEKVHRTGQEILHALPQAELFDVIVVDLPDPETIADNRYYTKEFFELCYARLSASGVLITQGGSPYLATLAFNCVDATLGAAGFNTLPIHNQVLTVGEWGWVLGHKTTTSSQMQATLHQWQQGRLTTRWLNEEAIQLITAWGKPVHYTEPPAVNTLSNPVLQRYYIKGNWRF